MATKLKTTEIDGVKYTYNPDILDDLERWEDFNENSPTELIKLYKEYFGDSWSKVKDKCRNENGVVKIKAVADFLAQIQSAEQ
jgi:hypothetical protein